MSEAGYATPEAAARGDIAERYCRVGGISLSPDGRRALVVLETNEPPAVECYTVVCERIGDVWFALGGSGGTGGGWTMGVGGWLTGDAPPGTVEAIVAHRGAEHRVAVQGINWSVAGRYRRK